MPIAIPDPFRAAVAALPAALRALVESELATGNEIAEIIHSFPAPPVGLCVRMAHGLSAQPAAAAQGLRPCRFPNWDGSFGFADEPGHFFVLGPPVPVPDPPSMDEIRAARGTQAGRWAPSSPLSVSATDDSPLRRFERSMVIDYEKWHDGIGYDIEAITAASPSERQAIEVLLLEHGLHDWRDVEALAHLNSPEARELLRKAKRTASHDLGMAIMNHAPDLLSDDDPARAPDRCLL